MTCASGARAGAFAVDTTLSHSFSAARFMSSSLFIARGVATATSRQSPCDVRRQRGREQLPRAHSGASATAPPRRARTHNACCNAARSSVGAAHRDAAPLTWCVRVRFANCREQHAVRSSNCPQQFLSWLSVPWCVAFAVHTRRRAAPLSLKRSLRRTRTRTEFD
jgi:hypothetical protein